MKIGVIGLGLIGGSIFKFLEESLEYEVLGISHSQNGKKNNITNDLNDLRNCEIVFVCLPMNKVLNVLDELEPILSKDAIVTDVCSVKEFVNKKKYSYNFIPGHPMAGTEFSGFENSFKELFENTKWVLCVKEDKKVKKLVDLISKMGAKPIFTTCENHDEAVALVSHMPMVVSQALFKAIKHNDLAMQLASSGFRDMTRLALSSEEMAVDMVNFNNKNIERAILKLYSQIGDLIKENYSDKIKEIKENRIKMYKNGKNII